MADWNKIKAEYIRGGTSQRKLAQKYGVSLSSLTRRATSGKWADLRRQTEIKSSAKICEQVASQEASRVDKIQDIADKLLQMIEERIKDGTLIADAKDLRSVTASIKDLREIKGCKSELDMQEQIARIEKLRREAAADEVKDTTITVKLEGDVEEWSR